MPLFGALDAAPVLDGVNQSICSNMWTFAKGESMKMAWPLNRLPPANVLLMLRLWVRYLVSNCAGPKRTFVSGKVPLAEWRLMSPEAACSVPSRT